MSNIVSRSALLGAVLAFCGGASAAGPVDDLHRAHVFVTGKELPERTTAFGEGLKEVLVKLSGDPSLDGDAAVAQLATNASAFVRAWTYRDLMAGIPVHDEQGTRQRPFELTIDFDPPEIDGVLMTLGREIWPAPRPRVAVFTRVVYGDSSYPLASDGERGRDQREALASAARRFGVPIVLPSARTTLPNPARPPDPTELEAAARALGGDVALSGTLTWSPDALTWTAQWRLVSASRSVNWQVSGVSFDAAFRSALEGAARILSDHGVPP